MTDDRHRQLLEESHEWPTTYTFKFIVPSGRVAEVEAILPDGAEIHHRASSGGKYVSVTGVVEMGSPDAVLAVYDAARAIDGIIGL
jgi:putative lipoic acid-binding regulatory protein